MRLKENEELKTLQDEKNRALLEKDCALHEKNCALQAALKEIKAL